MENQENIKLIIRYLSGELGEAEAQTLLTRLGSDAELYRLFRQLEQTWKMAQDPAEAPRFNREAAWKSVRAQTINRETVVSMPQRRSIPYLKWAAAIAALTIPAAILFNMMQQQETQWVSVNTGEEKQTLVLPDSTLVALNHHSELRYSIDPKEGKRLIELNGEAFFQVSRHADRPFEVRSAHALTQVLGTSFTVHDLKTDSMATIVVNSGKVAFGNPGKKEVLILEKGMSASIIRDAAPVKSSISNPNSQAWHTGRLEFRNTSIKDVASTLSDYFQVEIKVLSGAQCRFTGTFEQPTLEEVLDVLSFTMNGAYQKKADGYEIRVKECLLPNASTPQ